MKITAVFDNRRNDDDRESLFNSVIIDSEDFGDVNTFQIWVESIIKLMNASTIDPNAIIAEIIKEFIANDGVDSLFRNIDKDAISLLYRRLSDYRESNLDTLGDINESDFTSGMGLRITKCLLSENIISYYDLTLLNESRILKIPNLGKRGAEEVFRVLDEKSLRFIDKS